MNEQTHRPNWIRRNWIWLLSILVLLTIFITSLPKGVGNAALHITQGYMDAEVPESALKIVGRNERVREMLGELQPIGKMTI